MARPSPSLPPSLLPLASAGTRFHIPSARVPLAGLGLLCPALAVGAKLPGNGDDAEDDSASNQRVAAPVGRLSVPTTGRRPDVLGVTALFPIRATRQ